MRRTAFLDCKMNSHELTSTSSRDHDPLVSAAEPPAFLLADQPGAGVGGPGEPARGRGRRGRGAGADVSRAESRRRSTRRTGACSPRLIIAPKAKRVIYLFMSGGPSQLDLFDYKPLLNQMNGKDLPDSVRMGQRLTGMSANQATLPLAGSLFKFARHGKLGRLGQRALAPHGEGRRRALLHPLGVHRGDQPRPGDHVLPDRLADRGPAVDGVVAELRPGLGQPEPAHVLRPDQPAARSTSRSTRGSGATASSPRCTRACSSAPGRSRCSTSTIPPGVSAGGPPQDARPPARAAPDGVRRDARPGDQRPDRPVRDGLPDADLGPGGDQPGRGARPRLRPLRPRRPEAGHLRGQLPAGPAAGRARRPVHPALSSRLGPSRRPARGHPPADAARPTRPARP